MAFPFKLCEKLSDLVCKNCIFWIGGECRTSKNRRGLPPRQTRGVATVIGIAGFGSVEKS